MVNRPGRDKRTSKKGGFNYKRPAAEDIKRRAEAKGSRQYDSIFINSVDVYRPKEGDNAIRICPPTWDPPTDHYGYEVHVHQYIGADGGNYLCLKKNIDPKTGNKMNKPCAACDAAARAKSDGDDDEAKALEAKTRFVCWVVDRDDKDAEKLYDMSWTMDRDIATQSHNTRTGKTLFIADPDEGFDIRINRKGKDKSTKYVISIEREPCPLLEDQDEQDELAERLNDMPVPDCLHFYDNEYLRNVLEGTSDRGEDDNDAEDDTDTDDKPARGRRGKKDEDDSDDKPARRRRSARDADEDEAEGEDDKPARSRRGRRDEDEEDNEAEEAKPARSRRGKKDEDEDADEKPARGRRGRRDEDEEDEQGQDEEDERPARGRRGKRDEDEEDADDKPARSSRRSRRDAEEDDEQGEAEEDEAPRTRRRRGDDEDDKPAKKTGGKVERRRLKKDEDEDADEKPARNSRRSRRDTDDEEGEDDRPRRRR